MIKRASDLLSMWVGGTEQALRAAFEEAVADDHILLIDEVDSFLADRRQAVRSWEVTQVNELLTQVDGFTGILICCTNALHSLDRAAIRRFVWKVELRPLTPRGGSSRASWT